MWKITLAMWNKSISVGSDGTLDPGDIVTDFSVDSGVAFLRTTNSPGDNPLELPIADYWATRIPLQQRL